MHAQERPSLTHLMSSFVCTTRVIRNGNLGHPLRDIFTTFLQESVKYIGKKMIEERENDVVSGDNLQRSVVISELESVKDSLVKDLNMGLLFYHNRFIIQCSDYNRL